KGLAMGPMRRSLAEMEERYGVDLDANSHGQSFLRLFQSRFVPGGLYLLDEPEAPLTPQSQLALIAIISDTEPSELPRADRNDIGHGGAGRPVHHRDALARPDGVPGGDDRVVRRGAGWGGGVRLRWACLGER